MLLSLSGRHPDGACIAVQIGLMRICAVGSWVHFGSLVVSLAMLGFGLASVIMCLARDWFEGDLFAIPGFFAVCLQSRRVKELVPT